MTELQSILTTTVIGFIILFIAKWLLEYLITIKRYHKIKHMPILPFIGNLHQMKINGVDMFKLLNELSNRFKDEPIFVIYKGWIPVVYFHRADCLNAILSGNSHDVKSMEYLPLKPWLKEGLLISHGKKWTERRKMLTKSFHFDILKEFLVIMNEQDDILISKLKTLADTDEEFDISKMIGLCALDIICESAMGENINVQNGKNSDYLDAVHRINVYALKRVFNPILMNDFIYSLTKDGQEYNRLLKILHGFTQNVILKREKEFDVNNIGTSKRLAFLDLLLKVKHENGTLSADEIQEEVDTFMFEGHDTTSWQISWACHCIGSDSNVQKKIHEELDNIFGDSDRHVTVDDLSKMNYLELAIKETMRKYPVVTQIGRELTEDIVVDGHFLKKGLNVNILIHGIHQDERYFPEPEKFDPDRFLPENSKNIPPLAFIPFSAGKRNCIGQRFAIMEMKVLLSSIFRNFTLKSSYKTDDEILPSMDIILKPINGLPVKIFSRKK